MKLCRRCGQSKPEEEFYVHAAMKDGRLNICKPCVKARVHLHRAENVESIRWYDRQRGLLPHRKQRVKKYSKDHPEIMRRGRQRWLDNNGHKRAAQVIVRNAIRSKRIIPQPCIRCGRKAHAHHEDYSKPLDIVWLCPRHHSQRHKELREHYESP